MLVDKYSGSGVGAAFVIDVAVAGAGGGAAGNWSSGGLHSVRPLVCKARHGSVVGYRGALDTHAVTKRKINPVKSKYFIGLAFMKQVCISVSLSFITSCQSIRNSHLMYLTVES